MSTAMSIVMCRFVPCENIHRILIECGAVKQLGHIVLDPIVARWDIAIMNIIDQVRDYEGEGGQLIIL